MDIINKEKILEHAKGLAAEGKFDRAITEYERLLGLDPEDLRVKIKIAELYVKCKRIQDAIRLYTDVARAYSDGGFYLKAVTVYKNILRLNPSLIAINTALSELYEKMGLVQDALYQYQIVATALEQKNDEQGILAIREKMAGLDPENISLQIRLAETYQLQGVLDKAIDLYDALSRKLKNSGSQEQLMELYNKILAHRPERHDLLKFLCQMYYKRGEWKEIIKRMDGAKDVVARDGELLSMQADVYARLNQVETARGKYHDLAVLCAGNGDADGALKAYECVLFLSPESEDAIAKEVEGLKKGAFASVKNNVEARRKKAEAEETHSEDEKKPAEAGANVKIGKGEAADIQKGANASYDLGIMYKRMGLEAEAGMEFGKALKSYRRLVGGGTGERPAARILELEEMLSGVERKAEPIDQRPKTIDQRPKAEGKTVSKKKISFV